MTAQAEGEAADTDLVHAFIDGQPVSVPKGTLVIRAAEQVGVEIPRFCDHPLLDPVAACRQCLVEVEGMPKPQPACALYVSEDMKVKTQDTSTEAEIAQKGVMEFLLANHPLDCPVCDKGGECPLQNQAMTAGRTTSRYTLPKRTFPKPINVSAQVLLDRERCVNCQRCTRFADEIAGDPLIDLMERGAEQQIGIGEEPFDSYFSGNTIQICPVGALTSADYRFKARPFDLVSVPTTCEHCASGCATRTDWRHESVERRYAWEDPAVNEDWNCDKGRFAFKYLSENRLTTPLVREDGQLRKASWPEALRIVAARLAQAGSRSAVVTGGRLSLEDAYAYGRFARTDLGTDNIDFRTRPTSQEEQDFLASRVAGTAGPTYADLEAAPTVLLVGFEPEEESPIVYLRLRKAVRKHGMRVFSIAPFASEGLEKLSGELLATVPGSEAATLRSLPDDVAKELRADGAMILVGERLAQSQGGLSAAVALSEQTGASLAWIPRRAGERGSLDAGAISGLLPGGRPITDAAARQEVAKVWGIEALPETPGLNLAGIIAAIAADEAGAAAAEDSEEEYERSIEALILAGVDVSDVAEPAALQRAIDDAPFVVALDIRPTEVTAAADVVFPVATVAEKSGTFVDWEGRRRPFAITFPETQMFSDATVLSLIADNLDHDPAPRNVPALRAEIEALGAWAGERPDVPQVPAPPASPAGDNQTAVLATWRLLLDLGVTQEGAPYLAATRRPSVARISAATAAGLGIGEGDPVRVGSQTGSITLPVAVTEMPDGIVWVPTNSPDSRVTESLGVGAGATVSLSRPTDLTEGA